MELRQLRYFVAVASEGTYTAAAAASQVAQPALWRQVRDLELELGTRLFERHGRRVRLTREGEQLRELAVSAVTAAARVASVAEELRTARGGVLAIACAAPHLREILAAVITAFRERHPGVRVDVREYTGGPGPGRGMREDLLDGVVDLATGAPADEPGVESIPLYRSRVVVAVPDDHPWRPEAVIDVERLRDVPLVTTLRGAFSRAALDDAARRANIEPVIRFESPNPVSLVALGRAGLGLPVIVEDAVDHPSSPPWPALGDRGRPVGHEIRLGWRAAGQLNAAARSFVELAREEVARRATA